MKIKIIISIIVLTISSIGLGSYINQLNKERQALINEVLVQKAGWQVLIASMNEETQTSFLAEINKLLGVKEEK